MDAKEYPKQMDDITLPMIMRAIHAVNHAARRPTWVTVTDPASRIGGLSAQLIDSRHGGAWQIMWANGDLDDVPVQWCSMGTTRH